MPRNDQITRQWHLLRQLDGSSGRNLQEHVDNVPDDYPKNVRTVRRDQPAKMNLKVANNDELVDWILSFAGMQESARPSLRQRCGNRQKLS